MIAGDLRRAAARSRCWCTSWPTRSWPGSTGMPVTQIVADVWGGHTQFAAEATPPAAERRRLRAVVRRPTWSSRCVGYRRALHEHRRRRRPAGLRRCSSPTCCWRSSTCCPACRWTAAGSSSRWSGPARASGPPARWSPAGSAAAWPIAVRRARRRSAAGGATATPDPTLLIWSALISGLLWTGATQALRWAGMRRRATRLDARQLARPAVPVHATWTAARGAGAGPRAAGRDVVVLDASGMPIGLVGADAVDQMVGLGSARRAGPVADARPAAARRPAGEHDRRGAARSCSPRRRPRRPTRWSTSRAGSGWSPGATWWPRWARAAAPRLRA